MLPPLPTNLSLKARLLLALLKRRARTPTEAARYAERHTRFYRTLYAGRDLADFASLPVLHKAMVKDVDPFDLLAAPHAKDAFLYGETTGSSGSPTPVFLTRREFHGATLLARISPWNPVLKAVLRENRAVVNGLAFGFTIAGLSFGDVLANLGGLVANVGSRSTLATPERIARGIARLTPSVVLSTPLDFLGWMRILREDHPGRQEEVGRRLRLLLSTAELCADSRVAAIEREFGIRQINTYACVEGLFTLACPCGEKHVLDAYHVEILDEDLKPVPLGTRGRLSFTHLVKESSPMVRYLLDDDATLLASSCVYGFKTSVVPHGRYELAVRLGDRRWNVRDFEEEIFRVGLFGDYTVDVHDDRLEVSLEAYGRGTEAAGPAVRDRLEAATGLKADVKVVPFGRICRYREVRTVKPILKLRDRRTVSRQQVPEVL